MDFFVLGVVLVGLVAGYVVGTLGTAWGAICVPLLILLAVDPVVAIGTSLLAGSIVAIIAGGAHWRFGHVRWRILGPLLVAGTIAAVLGAWVAVHLSSTSLVLAVGGYEVLAGVAMLVKVPRKKARDDPRTLVGIGGLAGFVKGALGTGWGPIGTTLLILFGIYPALAVGSSMIARIAVSASSGLAYLGLKKIELAVMISLVCSGAVGGILGAFTTKKLSPRALRTVIGVAVVLLGILIILKQLVFLMSLENHAITSVC